MHTYHSVVPIAATQSWSSYASTHSVEFRSSVTYTGTDQPSTVGLQQATTVFGTIFASTSENTSQSSVEHSTTSKSSIESVVNAQNWLQSLSFDNTPNNWAFYGGSYVSSPSQISSAHTSDISLLTYRSNLYSSSSSQIISRSAINSSPVYISFDPFDWRSIWDLQMEVSVTFRTEVTWSDVVYGDPFGDPPTPDSTLLTPQTLIAWDFISWKNAGPFTATATSDTTTTFRFFAGWGNAGEELVVPNTYTSTSSTSSASTTLVSTWQSSSTLTTSVATSQSTTNAITTTTQQTQFTYYSFTDVKTSQITRTTSTRTSTTWYYTGTFSNNGVSNATTMVVFSSDGFGRALSSTVKVSAWNSGEAGLSNRSSITSTFTNYSEVSTMMETIRSFVAPSTSTSAAAAGTIGGYTTDTISGTSVNTNEDLGNIVPPYKAIRLSLGAFSYTPTTSTNTYFTYHYTSSTSCQTTIFSTQSSAPFLSTTSYTASSTCATSDTIGTTFSIPINQSFDSTGNFSTFVALWWGGFNGYASTASLGEVFSSSQQYVSTRTHSTTTTILPIVTTTAVGPAGSVWIISHLGLPTSATLTTLTTSNFSFTSTRTSSTYRLSQSSLSLSFENDNSSYSYMTDGSLLRTVWTNTAKSIDIYRTKAIVVNTTTTGVMAVATTRFTSTMDTIPVMSFTTVSLINGVSYNTTVTPVTVYFKSSQTEATQTNVAKTTNVNSNRISASPILTLSAYLSTTVLTDTQYAITQTTPTYQSTYGLRAATIQSGSGVTVTANPFTYLGLTTTTGRGWIAPQYTYDYAAVAIWDDAARIVPGVKTGFRSYGSDRVSNSYYTWVAIGPSSALPRLVHTVSDGKVVFLSVSASTNGSVSLVPLPFVSTNQFNSIFVLAGTPTTTSYTSAVGALTETFIYNFSSNTMSVTRMGRLRGEDSSMIPVVTNQISSASFSTTYSMSGAQATSGITTRYHPSRLSACVIGGYGFVAGDTTIFPIGYSEVTTRDRDNTTISGTYTTIYNDAFRALSSFAVGQSMLLGRPLVVATVHSNWPWTGYAQASYTFPTTAEYPLT